MSYDRRISDYQARVEQTLERWLPAADHPPKRLHEAMRYASLNGGKRLRPILIYTAGEVLGISCERLDGPAAAVEMVHAYSLAHDDLPAMDDDDLRRNRPTCHVAFDEATAILAGDALQALAFHVLATDPAMECEPSARVQMINLLAEAGGSLGMAGGQAIDLDSVGKTLSVAELENMHIHKTGALIRASVLMACHSLPLVDNDKLQALDRYAKRVGLAFQIQDDILDEEGDTETLGKTRGADRARNKPTFPSILGLADSKQRARELVEEAVDALSDFGENADPLVWLAWHIIDRRN